MVVRQAHHIRCGQRQLPKRSPGAQ